MSVSAPSLLDDLYKKFSKLQQESNENTNDLYKRFTELQQESDKEIKNLRDELETQRIELESQKLEYQALEQFAGNEYFRKDGLYLTKNKHSLPQKIGARKKVTSF